jgi:hypothetical protein
LQRKALDEPEEVRALRCVFLVQVSRYIAKIQDSQLQIREIREFSPCSKLKCPLVELPQKHLPFRLLKVPLQSQELLEEFLYGYVLWLLPRSDVPTLLFFAEGKEFLLWNLKQDVHCGAHYTVCPLPTLPILLKDITIHIAKAKSWFEFMQLLDDYLLPLPTLYPVLCCVCSWEVLLELMDHNLRPLLSSIRSSV